MRFLLLLAVIMVASLVAGAMAGVVLARGTQPPENLTLPGMRGIASLSEAPPQVRGARSSRQTLTHISSRSTTAPLRVSRESIPHPVPLTIAAGASTSDRFFQVSRQFPSTLTVHLILIGDSNMDGVVDTSDLLLVTRALGTMPTNQPIVDWNGDGQVDVLDLAILASHLGEMLP